MNEFQTLRRDYNELIVPGACFRFMNSDYQNVTDLIISVDRTLEPRLHTAYLLRMWTNPPDESDEEITTEFMNLLISDIMFSYVKNLATRIG